MRMPAVSFRSMEQADLPMVHEWLTRPHVAEWWRPTPTLEELIAEYQEWMVGPVDVLPYIALADAMPIGYIQSYVVMGAGDGWWPDERDPGARGIDQYLADGTRLGQGLGTAMVRAFVERLFADPAVTRIQTDPDPANGRAIRCYEKAGFHAVREMDTPDGRALLMVRDRPGGGLPVA